MSRWNYRAFIENAQHEQCTDAEFQALCEIFERVMKDYMKPLIRKAHFDLTDFVTAKQHGLEGFNLVVEKYPYAGADQWMGVFERNGKKLKVLGTLERD